ncbi:bifunctional diaminohydroxyphosphoribosylaminopyrimidine deaminase/5-amino-6-(5-phosphoribosylamino)uracil reductase RibD [soil metagenome]
MMPPVAEQWMRRALDLAERGRGCVEPNPLVGAVIVRDGQVVGEGWHERFGQAHAEINAITSAGAAARGATLYCTLEPCCHQGKTGPCTDAVIRAGITRVVAAMLDPFPQVSGKGCAQLRAANIAVETGVCEAEARLLNAPYLKLLTTGQPYVHAKWAMTLDGKIATARGDSKWISNETSRRWVHDFRGRVDAILVGRGTVLADNPLLTARPPGPRIPLRIVLDRAASLPLTSRLIQTLDEAPLLVVTSEECDVSRQNALRAAGCEVLPLPCPDDASMVSALLDELGRRRFTNLLVEGGSRVLGSFCDAGAIDRVHVFLAPRLLGGASAMSPIGGRGADLVIEGLPIESWSFEPMDGDILIHGIVGKRPAGYEEQLLA